MNRIGELNDKLSKNPTIYRIELLDRFYKMLDSKKIIFVKPDKWEDPLENLIFNAKLFKNGLPYKNLAKDRIYSQCWSYEGDSYGIWKIYTTKANDDGEVKRHFGVRIATKLDNLKEISRSNKGDFYFGLVKYLWKYQIDKLPSDPKIKSALSITKPSECHLETLLLKRKSYSYEHEVRLFAIPDDNHIDKKKEFLCNLDFEPSSFITSIKFDPGMEYNEFREHKNILISKYGFKNTQITQSTYFKKNKYSINLD